MAKYIQHRLLEQIQAAGEAGQVEAVIVVRAQDDPALAADDGGLARQVIDRAARLSGDPPDEVRYFPRANAAVVLGSGRLIQAILEDELIAVASATDFNPLL